MPRTVLSKGNRFHVRGVEKVLWIPRGATPPGPLTLTLPMLDDATTVDLTPAIVPPVAGFNIDQADTPAPDLGSLVTGTVEGEATYGASSLTFYLSSDGPTTDVRGTLVTGAEGYLVIADSGIGTGKTYDIAEATVKFGMKQRDDLARIQVPFTIAGLQENVPHPAA